MAAGGSTSRHCERTEWRAVAWPLATLLAAFGAGWAYGWAAHGVELGSPAAVAYAIGVGWLARALVGCAGGGTAPIEGAALEAFRDRCFWSPAARISYATVLLCDGLFLADQWPDQPALFFAFAALAAAFSLRVSLLAVAVAAYAVL